MNCSNVASIILKKCLAVNIMLIFGKIKIIYSDSNRRILTVNLRHDHLNLQLRWVISLTIGFAEFTDMFHASHSQLLTGRLDHSSNVLVFFHSQLIYLKNFRFFFFRFSSIILFAYFHWRLCLFVLIYLNVISTVINCICKLFFFSINHLI